MDLQLFSYEGMDVFIHPYIGKPRMQMAPGDYISSEMRRFMDEWLLEFFGREAEIVMIGRKLICSPRAYEQLKHLFKEKNDGR